MPRSEGTFHVKITGRKAKIVVSSDGSGIISHSGGLLLLETVRATGLGRGLSEGLQRWWNNTMRRVRSSVTWPFVFE
jgi:hypothetical protein